MFRRTPRPAAAAVLSIALAAALVISAGPSGATTASADRFTPDGHDGAASIVGLGNGDRVRVVQTSDGAPRLIDAVPSKDGTTPGLLLEADDNGTTLRAADGTARPAVLEGAAPIVTKQATDDLVELHFAAIGRDGREASADVTVFDVESGATQAVRRLPGDGGECTTDSFEDSDCVLVPPGTYSVLAFVNTNPAGRPSTERERTVQNISLTGDAETLVETDRNFTFDARLASPVEVRTPGRRTAANAGGAMELGYTRVADNGRQIKRLYRPTSTLDEQFFMEATAQVGHGDFETLTRMRLEAPAIELTIPGRTLHPHYFDPVWFSDVITQFPRYDGKARLRVVDIGHATAADLRGKQLDGTVAVAERSDTLSVAEQSNAAADAGAELVVIHNDGPGDNDDPGATGTKLQVPTLRLDRAEGKALKATRGRVGVQGETASPYLYDLVLKQHGGIPKNLTRVVKDRDLATQIRRVHGQPTVDSTFSEAAYQYQPDDTFAVTTMFPFDGGARQRTEYRLVDPETRWTYATVTPQSRYNHLFPQPPELAMVLGDPDLVAYESRQQISKSVGTAPVTSAPSAYQAIERSGDQMQVSIEGFVDADGNHGTSYTTDSGMQTLLRIEADGEVIGETENLPSGVAVLPPGDSHVAVSFTADNPQQWAELSTRTATTWKFRSETTTPGQTVVQPVILADYDVDLDLRNRMSAHPKKSAQFGVRLHHAAGAAEATIDKVTLDASYDDGATWRRAAISNGAGDRWQVTLPKGSGHLSLRLRAADDAGSSLDQTIIRAWYIGR